MAGAYLDDESLQAEAALAAAKIALPDKGKNNGLGGYETAQILKKVAGSLKNEKLKRQVLQYIETLPKSASVKKPVPEGFVVAFNGKDLSGWKGVLLSPHDNPVKRAALNADRRAELQAKADENMRNHWSVQDGVLVFDGKGYETWLAESVDLLHWVDISSRLMKKSLLSTPDLPVNTPCWLPAALAPSARMPPISTVISCTVSPRVSALSTISSAGERKAAVL